jgi:hypothetical protein
LAGILTATFSIGASLIRKGYGVEGLVIDIREKELL